MTMSKDGHDGIATTDEMEKMEGWEVTLEKVWNEARCCLEGQDHKYSQNGLSQTALYISINKRFLKKADVDLRLTKRCQKVRRRGLGQLGQSHPLCVGLLVQGDLVL